MTRTALALLFAATAAGFAGCTKPPEVKGGGGPEQVAVDPWPPATAELRRATDMAACRRVLNQLSGDIAANPKATAPEAMTDDAAAKLTAQLRLTPDEQKELRGTAYTGADAAYLASALYLRDVARSLDVAGAAPEIQAAAAFAWVCRQVYLRPWQIATGRGQIEFGPTVAPLEVLRRGYGSGIERAYIYLALAQQLGFDAVLVGGPGKEASGVGRAADGTPAKGPFWAVGAKTQAGVVLFDPWRGEAVPGPGGKGVATLDQLKATPDLVKAWRADAAKPWDVTPDDVKAAVAYVSVPLSAVKPRIKLLESQTVGGVGVKLYQDVTALAARAGSAVWAPPMDADPSAYARVLFTTLSKDEGGVGNPRLGELLAQDVRPRSLLSRPPGLEYDEAAMLLGGAYLGEYEQAFVTAGPREKIHRGQFNDASRYLVEQERIFTARSERTRTNPFHTANVADWVGKANAVYRKLSDARKPENRTNLPAAELDVANFWKSENAGAAVVFDAALAPVGMGEAVYLLAGCKNEQAERAQARLARADAAARPAAVKAAADAWAAAKDAWDRYLPYADGQDRSFPGRAAHARGLAGRATKLAADPATGL